MTGYVININSDCNQCMECVEVCQTEVLTEDLINMFKDKMNSVESPFKYCFRKYVRKCTYCESCEGICEQKAIWILHPEWVEL